MNEAYVSLHSRATRSITTRDSQYCFRLSHHLRLSIEIDCKGTQKKGNVQTTVPFLTKENTLWAKRIQP
jgi:hypothetical protein